MALRWFLTPTLTLDIYRHTEALASSGARKFATSLEFGAHRSFCTSCETAIRRLKNPPARLAPPVQASGLVLGSEAAEEPRRAEIRRQKQGITAKAT